MIEETISMVGRIPPTLSLEKISALCKETGICVNAHNGQCEIDLSDLVERSMDRPGDPWNVGDKVPYSTFDFLVRYSIPENLN